jgi:hypothetical protein
MEAFTNLASTMKVFVERTFTMANVTYPALDEIPVMKKR